MIPSLKNAHLGKPMRKLFLKTLIVFTYLFTVITVANAMVMPEDIIVYPSENGIKAKRVILDEINAAQISIQMSIYQIKDAEIIQALCNKSEAGINVDVIYEETPYQHAFNQGVGADSDNLLAQIKSSKIRLHQRPENLKTLFPNGHYHARYIIIDNNRFLLSTGNFDGTTFDHCRDFCVIFSKDKNQVVFKALVDLFNRDIKNESIADLPESEDVIIGPHNQREKILSFLGRAKSNVKMYQQFFNDPAIKECVKTLIAGGIKVELVMMAYPLGYELKDPSVETQNDLQAGAADVRLMDHLYAHGRAIIIDDTYAMIGTTQLSPPSLDENREISIVIEGLYFTKLVEQFSQDQAVSQANLKEARDTALIKKVKWNEVVLG